jgi:3-oxoacyl-[acyl-carrier protein] reductase
VPAAKDGYVTSDFRGKGVVVTGAAQGNTRISGWVIEDPVLGPEFLKKIPLGRFGEPADIARAVGFLAGEDSAYMTGQTLVLDGGYSLGFPIEPRAADLPGREAGPAGAEGGTP